MMPINVVTKRLVAIALRWEIDPIRLSEMTFLEFSLAVADAKAKRRN